MSWADLAASTDDVCAETFGQIVQYRQTADEEPPRDILAVFDEEALTGTLMGGESRTQIGKADLNTTEPMLFVRRAVLPFKPADGHLVDIDGQRYRVSEVRPDGPMSWALPLKKNFRR